MSHKTYDDIPLRGVVPSVEMLGQGLFQNPRIHYSRGFTIFDVGLYIFNVNWIALLKIFCIESP